MEIALTQLLSSVAVPVIVREATTELLAVVVVLLAVPVVVIDLVADV